MSQGNKLTPKQQAFVDNYLITKNGVEAARVAGYKGNDRVLQTIASENLSKPIISQALGLIQQQASEDAKITLQMIINEYAAVAFGSTADLFEWDHETVSFIPKKEMNAKQRAFLESISAERRFEEFNETDEDSGELVTRLKPIVKYKVTSLADKKLDALAALTKLLGFDKPEDLENGYKKAFDDALAALDAEEAEAKAKAEANDGETQA